MSLLLDALRKSERQRKLGRAPDIEVPAMPTERPRGTSARWLLLPLVLLLAVVGWWLLAGNDRLKQQDEARSRSEQPSAEQGALAGADVVPADISGQSTQRAVAAATSDEEAYSNAENEQPSLLAQNRDAGFKVPQPRAGLPPGPLPQQDNPGDDRRGSLSSSLATAMDSAPQSAASLDELVRRDELSRQAEQDAASSQSGLALDETSSDAAQASVAMDVAEVDDNAPAQAAERADDWRPGQPEPISYYELPVAVRQELQDFRVTIRIYNEDPAQRFAVINQQRFFEGDEVGQGMRLQEIRRDGVVFEFEQYRFLLQ